MVWSTEELSKFVGSNIEGKSVSVTVCVCMIEVAITAAPVVLDSPSNCSCALTKLSC